jgi:hypothetical protein
MASEEMTFVRIVDRASIIPLHLDFTVTPSFGVNFGIGRRVDNSLSNLVASTTVALSLSLPYRLVFFVKVIEHAARCNRNTCVR